MLACWTIGTCSFIYIGSYLVLKNKINRTKSRRPYQFSSRVFVTSLRRRKNHKDARYKAWLLFLQRTRLVILLRCIVDSYPCPSLMTTSVHLCCQELTHKVWAEKRSFSGYLIGKLLKCMQSGTAIWAQRIFKRESCVYLELHRYCVTYYSMTGIGNCHHFLGQSEAKLKLMVIFFNSRFSPLMPIK